LSFVCSPAAILLGAGSSHLQDQAVTEKRSSDKQKCFDIQRTEQARTRSHSLALHSWSGADFFVHFSPGKCWGRLEFSAETVLKDHFIKNYRGKFPRKKMYEKSTRGAEIKF
jgi:hypothetical protein